MTPEYLNRCDATCTKCGQQKRPTKGHVRLLRSQNLPYVCKACREQMPIQLMDLGKLGKL